MKNLSAGKEVLSYCNSCKTSLAHTIVVMKKELPGKVECHTCKKTHAYKDPSKVNLTKTKTRKIVRSKKENKIPLEQIWQKALNESKASEKKYTIKENFGKDDLIKHKIFGLGIVEKVIDSSKIEVIFQTEIRILVHNK